MGNKNTFKKFGAIVKDKREEKKLTREEFSQQTGIGVSEIEQIEEGRIDTTFPMIVIIAKTLKIKLPELLKDL